MKSLMALSMLILMLSGAATAQESTPSRSFNYDGQNSENVLLELIRKETRYRDRTIDTTCERQVQVGEREECGNETRYRQECRTIPGRNDCRDVYDQECDIVTRYRNECRYEPGQQQCRNEPGRQVCRQGPPRQVCTTRRNGAQVCTTQPGQQICRTEPGRRVCDNAPGRQVCRQVPYTDRVCRNVTRRQCDWIPSRQDCQQIPYNEWVCRQVPVYETQTYACQQTVKEPYEALAEKINADFDFEFSGATNNARAKFNAEIRSGGRLVLTANDKTDNSKLIIAKRNIETESDGVETRISGSVKIRFENSAKFLGPVQTKFTNFDLGQNSLSFTMGKVLNPNDLTLTIKISKEGDTELNKTLTRSQFSIVNVGEKSKVEVDFNKLFGVKLSRGVFKKHVYDVTITAKIELPSELLNTPAPSNTKAQTFSARPDKD